MGTVLAGGVAWLPNGEDPRWWVVVLLVFTIAGWRDLPESGVAPVAGPRLARHRLRGPEGEHPRRGASVTSRPRSLSGVPVKLHDGSWGVGELAVLGSTLLRSTALEPAAWPVHTGRAREAFYLPKEHQKSI